MDEHRPITPIGVTNYRNQNIPFGIKDEDRFGHIYVVGKTGTGKSTLLKTMALSDIKRGLGCAIIDPHGDIAEELVHRIDESGRTDFIYFNASDLINPIAFNPLCTPDSAQHHLVASGLIATFKKIWADSWGPRLEYILRYSILTLLDYPDATLLDIQTLLTNSFFRDRVLAFCSNYEIKSFWKNEFDKYPHQFRIEVITPILNKTGLFVSSLPLRTIVGQKSSDLNIQGAMDEGKILIANLSKGKIGEDASTILGSMLVNAFQLGALHRASQDEDERRPFFLYIDEAHSFISESIADILSEARKYKLSLFLAHQYIDQFSEETRSAIFGNVGTIISFRVGYEDAEQLAKEFFPVFTEEDLVNLPKYSMYLKLMIDGATSQPFSAKTLLLEKEVQSKLFKVSE